MTQKNEASFVDISFCYNCSNYDTKTDICNKLAKKKERFGSCSFFNQRSSFTKDDLTEKKEQKKKKPPIGKFNLLIEHYTQNVTVFYEYQQFFYDAANIFWFWNEELSKYEQVDDTDVMNALDDILGFKGMTVNAKLKSHYMEAFKRVGRKKVPKAAPSKWIQFKDKAISLKSGKTYDVTPDYFFTNPIPWEIGQSSKTPTLDNLFKEWVGEKYVKTMYELIAYCCYTDYPIQLLFCLVGSGRNGKGCFLKVLDNFIGKYNVTSTSLDLISGNNKSRFESFKLYKKLVALMGETNFGLLNNTSLLKQLTGGDKIGFEKKGKDPFDEYNYAKIIIASNSLPTTQDTSDGFFRRWFIIDFQNEFKEGKDITKTIPDREYNNLAKKVTKILPELIEKGHFTNQGEIEERKKKYIMASNPISLFLNKCCVVEEDDFVKQGEIYSAYLTFLKKHKRRRIKLTEFKTALEEEGFWIEKESKNINGDWKNARWVNGLGLKTNWRNLIWDVLDVLDTSPTPPLHIENKGGVASKTSQMSQAVVPQEIKVTEETIE